MALRNAFLAALVAAVAVGCAAPREPATVAAPAAPPAPAKPKCEPPPGELVVKDLAPGKGKTVRFRSAVTVGYTGWLYDGCKPDFKGAQFDSSVGRAAPFGFMVGAGRVIRGWDEGIIGMQEGGKRLLIIPPNKAYGDRVVAGGKIPPNSTLVFEVDLYQVVAQADGKQ
jgi:FKBP-type peptidyl-prolyl cis-trans isomerase FkpA